MDARAIFFYYQFPTIIEILNSSGISMQNLILHDQKIEYRLGEP